jgi:hypothetical protein
MWLLVESLTQALNYENSILVLLPITGALTRRTDISSKCQPSSTDTCLRARYAIILAERTAGRGGNANSAASVRRQAKKHGGASQLAALKLYAHKVLEEFQKKSEAANLAGWLKRYSDVHRENKKAHDEINGIYESCVTVAYLIYSKEIKRDPVIWNRAGQETFLGELRQMEEENDSVFFTSQQPTGFTPSQLLDSKPEEAFRCAFYVHPASARDERRPLYDPVNRIQSRISLSIQPEHVSSIARKLATEFGGEFDDILSRYKILSAKEHGGTPDNIVIYLSKASPERAKQFAAHLKSTTPPQTWETYSPIGMHQFLAGIAYAESAPGASSSFGMSRARLVARAVIKHLVDKVELDAALEEALTENHYSLRNPAFVERKGLNDLLQRL